MQNYYVDGHIWSGLDQILQKFPGGAAPIFKEIGVNLTNLGRYGTTEPLSKYVAFFEVGAKISNDLNFGLHVGSFIKPLRSGLPGNMCLHSKNLYDGIINLKETLPTLIQGMELSFEESEEGLTLFSRILDPKLKGYSQFDDLCMAYLLSMLRGVMGRHWSPKEVHFEHSLKGDDKFYKRFFNTTVRFDQPINAILIKKDDLDKKNRNYNPYLLEMMKYYARDHIESSAIELSITERTTLLLQEAFETGRTDILYIAERLSIPTHSLHRLLKREGQTFRKLLENTRIERASQYLSNTTLQVSIIAQKLGYSETSALSRSFQRVKGISPSAYRMQK